MLILLDIYIQLILVQPLSMPPINSAGLWIVLDHDADADGTNAPTFTHTVCLICLRYICRRTADCRQLLFFFLQSSAIRVRHKK